MDDETLKKYEERLEEGYDCEVDQLYCTWRKLKQQSSRAPLGDITNKSVVSVSKQKDTLNKLFQVPKATSEKPEKSIRGTACLPKHISGDEVIKILADKKAKKELEEKKKVERQQQKEERKKKKEEEEKEQARKKEEREEQKKRKEAECKSKTGKRNKGQRRSAKKANDKSDEYKCPTCGIVYIEECDKSEIWIECESCNQWYHWECTSINDPKNDTFICTMCA